MKTIAMRLGAYSGRIGMEWCERDSFWLIQCKQFHTKHVLQYVKRLADLTPWFGHRFSRETPFTNALWFETKESASRTRSHTRCFFVVCHFFAKDFFASFVREWNKDSKNDKTVCTEKKKKHQIRTSTFIQCLIIGHYLWHFLFIHCLHKNRRHTSIRLHVWRVRFDFEMNFIEFEMYKFKLYTICGRIFEKNVIYRNDVLSPMKAIRPWTLIHRLPTGFKRRSISIWFIFIGWLWKLRAADRCKLRWAINSSFQKWLTP